MLVFDLEKYNDQECAEAYGLELYDVNRLRDRWERDLTPDEKVTEKRLLSFLMDLVETLS